MTRDPEGRFARDCAVETMKPDSHARFWRQINKRGPDECWPWTAYQDKDGYGIFKIDGRPFRSHRVSLLLCRPQNADGMLALHSCDNPSCCNPAHLRWGTNADNASDRDKRGRTATGFRNGKYTKPERTPIGEAHSQAKLTADLVVLIRNDQRPQRKIAADYGISQTHVGEIKARKTWAHVI